MARYLPDGNIEFLGRNDNQVKVRGFRIEPGEIETALTQHPFIDHALVVAYKETHDTYLVAYLIFNSEENLSTPQLREHLKVYVPDYMLRQLLSL